MKKHLLYLFIIIFVFKGYAQNDNCGKTNNSKAIKLFEKSKNRKKYKLAERTDFLQEAINLDENYIEAQFYYAKKKMTGMKSRSASTKSLAPNFEKIIAICPDFHSDPYYFLANIKLETKKYGEAMKLYKQFINYQNDDEKRYSKDYDKKVAKAKQNYIYAKFYKEVYMNPVPFNPMVVKDVSTRADEYLPLISPDNGTMLFTRRTVKEPPIRNGVKVRQSVVHTDKQQYLERFSYSKHLVGKFDSGTAYEAPFNQDEQVNYGGATLSIDNKHLYMTMCKPKSGYINCDIFSSDYVYSYNDLTEKEEWHWTPLKNMGANVNTDDGWESQPTLSADGKTLIFAAYRPDSRQMDLYKTEKQENGTWGVAENMGEPINTAGNEKTPFIHSDSHTLYYASDGHMGFGSYDVFYSRTDSVGNWQEPHNIGYPINTSDAEHGFIVSTDGKTVYFASDQLKNIGDGGYDIFSFQLHKKARPEKVVFLKGTIKDEHNEVIKDAKIEIKNTKTNEVSEIKVDTIDGSYAAVVTLKKDEDIVLNIKSASKTSFNSKLFTMKDTAQKTFVQLNVKVEEIKVGKSFKINDIYYTTSSATIDKDSKHILDEFIAFLRENKTIKVAIYGHTDNLGDDQRNLALSTDRAFSVMEYIQSKGVAKKRLSFKGFGETKPIANNDTETGRAKNRRTEFFVVSK